MSSRVCQTISEPGRCESRRTFDVRAEARGSTFYAVRGDSKAIFLIKGTRFAGLSQLAYNPLLHCFTPPSPTIHIERKARIMEHTLPPLPFDKNALAPHMSEETLEYHYGK